MSRTHFGGQWFWAGVFGLWLACGSIGRAEVVTLDSEEGASLGGLVWIDLNNDAVRDEWERPLQGIVIWLEGIGLDDEEVVLSTTTGVDGTYLFENLTPGTYSLRQEQPERYVPGRANPVGAAGGEVSDDGNLFSNIVVTAGTQSLDYNFGEWGARAKYVSLGAFLAIPVVFAVPEPGTLALLGIGLLTLLAGRTGRRFVR